MKHLFGPVPSRRLGLSLGVDLVPFKTCTLDCIYCECGKTEEHNLTLKRSEYISFDELRLELDTFLGTNPKLDYITMTGSGEPTLNTSIGKLIGFLRENYPRYKIALLTNGTLLFDETVRNEIAPVDLVLPSLDAVSPGVFSRINKPCANLNIEDAVKGLITFSHMFKGTIWVEVFIVPGVNDTESELALFKQVLHEMRVDRVQLNALDRPAAYDDVQKAGKERLLFIKDYFGDLPVEIIAKYDRKKEKNEVEDKAGKKDNSEVQNVGKRVLAMLKRRPCTLEDILHSTGEDKKTIEPLILSFLAEGKIIAREKERGTFYSCL